MTYFLFQPDKEVEVGDAWMNQGRAIEPLSFLYNSKADVWMVLDPKSGYWLDYMQEGVPEYYKAQMLLLIAAYLD